MDLMTSLTQIKFPFDEVRKACFKCNKEKRISDFYKHPQMADGHLNKCKECTKKDARTTRSRRIEYYRKYDRLRFQQPERRRKHDEYRARYIRDHPEKYTARNILNAAIRDGKVHKAECCEWCGSEWHLHGHHEDYSKPLDVIWLCVRCHHKRHKELRHEHHRAF